MNAPKYVASFDIGTTGAKGVLVGKDGTLSGGASIPLDTIYGEHHTVEQHPEQWYKAVAEITQAWWASGVDPKQIMMIVFSGQMQDCIPVDGDGNPVRPAILYSDARASLQAGQVLRKHGEDTVRRVTGNPFDGSMTFPKIIWMKENEPELYRSTASFLISSKDYVVRKLTGRLVTDPTTAATSGMMELPERRFVRGWLQGAGIEADKLPELLAADEVAGFVLEEAAAFTGFVAGTPVLCGIGDAGATTLGAGVTEVGEMYAYLGTTGWVALPTREPGSFSGGVFQLAHVDRELLITIAPLMNAGNAHRWALNVFGCGEAVGDAAFAEMERAMEQCERRDHGVLFLPYLNGERCPVQDPHATGCFIGLTASTTKAEMSRAVLEGVAMAMRQVKELLACGWDVKRLTLIGGGSRSRVWSQTIADVLGVEVVVPQESQYLPALGGAATAFVRFGWAESYAAFARNVLDGFPAERYSPDASSVEMYDRAYAKYVMLYPALADVFGS